MEPLDGNAIAGLLHEVFGSELTAAVGVCAACGARRVVAELAVYVRAPGAVARCPRCDATLVVVAEVRGRRCVDLTGLARLELA